MNAKQATENLDGITKHIENAERVRLAALAEVGKAVTATETENCVAAIEHICAAHRILANNNPDGQFVGGVENTYAKQPPISNEFVEAGCERFSA